MANVSISGSYHVVVTAPGVAPAPARAWLVRAFDVAAGQGGVLASCTLENLEAATDHVFRAIRADIDDRLRRAGHAVGIAHAAHDGAGGDDHRSAASGDGLTRDEIARWCARIDYLLAKRPDVNAHQLRNMAGEFAFSPGSCPLCRALADIEARALAEITSAPEGARA